MMPKVFSTAAMAGILILSPLAGSAQVTPPRGGQGAQRQRMEMEQRLQLGFQRTIQNQLGLDQDRIEKVRGIMQSFQGERQALNQAQASLRYRLRDPALPDMDEADARALLQEMVDLQQRELDLYKREQTELLTVLAPAQLIRFYRLREDLGQRVQQLRQGRGQGGGQGGVGGQSGLPGGRGIGGRPLR